VGPARKGNLSKQIATLGYPANKLPESVDSRVSLQFIERRSEVHLSYIRETETTKRLGSLLAAILLALGCALPIFAPAGREAVALIVGCGLVLFAAGALGFTRFKLGASSKKVDLSAEGRE